MLGIWLISRERGRCTSHSVSHDLGRIRPSSLTGSDPRRAFTVSGWVTVPQRLMSVNGSGFVAALGQNQSLIFLYSGK